MSISTTTQWLIRGIQLSSATIVLAIYSFFLASHTPSPIERAIAAISGSATAYTLITLLLLIWHSSSWPLPTTFFAVLLDAAFAAAFIYVAAANRLHFNRCAGNDAGTVECRLQTACLVVSIVAVVFFALSVVVQLALVRRRGKQARHPWPANSQGEAQGEVPGQGEMKSEALKGGIVIDDAVLPRHALPDQVDDRYFKYETAYGHHQGGRHAAYRGLGSPHYRYDDGIYDL